MEIRPDRIVALITGATQGVDAAIAKAVARSGAGGQLITGRDVARGEAFAEKLADAGVSTAFLAADLAERCGRADDRRDRRSGTMGGRSEVTTMTGRTM